MDMYHNNVMEFLQVPLSTIVNTIVYNMIIWYHDFNKTFSVRELIDDHKKVQTNFLV